ncbi:MAG: hypothetical protein M3313_15730 [Actinomycetota bacterium]|nr:hypothetical protein [Actinomycetota bacterium]
MTWIDVLSPEGAQPETESGDVPRLSSLQGALIGLHDNAKPGAVDLLTVIGADLVRRGAQTQSWSKAHAARPSPHIPELASSVTGALFALGD